MSSIPPDYNVLTEYTEYVIQWWNIEFDESIGNYGYWCDEWSTDYADGNMEAYWAVKRKHEEFEDQFPGETWRTIKRNYKEEFI